MAEIKKIIFLIGVTGGVGETVGKTLSAAGYDVYATCRTAAQRDQLDNKLYKRVLLMDLASTPSVEAAFAELAAAGVTRLDGLINCAAALHGVPLELVKEEEMTKVFQINVFGTLRAIQLAIPLLRIARGRIVMIGSLSGHWAMPLTGVYTATKFVLESFCDILRRELYPWGIKVSVLKPGGIDTAMLHGHIDAVGKELQALHGDELMYAPLYRAHARVIPLSVHTAVSTQKMADYVMHALTSKRPKARYFIGVESKFTTFLVRFMPHSVQDLFSRFVFSLK